MFLGEKNSLREKIIVAESVAAAEVETIISVEVHKQSPSLR